MKVRLSSGKLLLPHFWSLCKRIYTETVGPFGPETAKTGSLRREKGSKLKVTNLTLRNGALFVHLQGFQLKFLKDFFGRLRTKAMDELHMFKTQIQLKPL